MKKLSETYKEHEFGIEAPEGHLLESSEDYLEELNDLLKERDEARELAEWMLADALPVRFQLQLHKIIWADAKGK